MKLTKLQELLLIINEIFNELLKESENPLMVNDLKNFTAGLNDVQEIYRNLSSRLNNHIVTFLDFLTVLSLKSLNFA